MILLLGYRTICLCAFAIVGQVTASLMCFETRFEQISPTARPAYSYATHWSNGNSKAWGVFDRYSYNMFGLKLGASDKPVVGRSIVGLQLIGRSC
jgi:hypothetical protein